MPQVRTLLLLLAALLLSASALADDRRCPDPFAAVEPRQLFHGMVREDDVALLFDYLRRGVAAAARGDHPPPPDELQRRAEVLGHELRQRGALAALILLGTLEARARDALREPMAPRRPLLPPTEPYTPLRH